MNKRIYQEMCLPNKKDVRYTVHNPSYEYTIEISSNLKGILYGMLIALAMVVFNTIEKNHRKNEHIQNSGKMKKAIFLQHTIEYGAILYIVAAMVAMPSGICSSSYQLPTFEYPLIAAHRIFDVNNEAIPISMDFVFLAQAPVETRPSKVNIPKAPPFHNYILRASRIYEVDIALIRAIIMAESSYNPKAVSHQGAKGLMQLMPTTAKSLGVEDAFDPELNIDGGVRYFKRLLDRFDGNVELALAAYNAGSRYVRKYGGVPPFKETRGYIKKVFKYRRKYQKEMVSNQGKPTIGLPSML